MSKVGPIIIAVFSIACLSNAELVYQVDGVTYAPGSTITVQPGTEVVIAVYNTADQIFCYDLGAVIVSGDATFGNPGTATVYSENLPGTWSTQNFGYWTDYDGLGHDGEIFLISYDYPSLDQTLEGKLFDYTVQFTGPTATFAMADTSWYASAYGAGLTLAAPAAEPGAIVESNDPEPAAAPMEHGSVLIYKINAHLAGYTYNNSVSPRTVRPCNYNFSGYAVADINTKSLCTNYPSAPDGNSPTFIIVTGSTFTTFTCSDAAVVSALDLAKSDSAYYQKFYLLNSAGHSTHKDLVMPTFDFSYTNGSKIFALFDDGLTGNIATTDIGETTKKYVTTAIIGRAEFDLGPGRKVCGPVSLTLDSYLTRYANGADMRVRDAVKMIERSLQRKNYRVKTLSAFGAQ